MPDKCLLCIGVLMNGVVKLLRSLLSHTDKVIFLTWLRRRSQMTVKFGVHLFWLCRDDAVISADWSALPWLGWLAAPLKMCINHAWCGLQGDYHSWREVAAPAHQAATIKCDEAFGFDCTFLDSTMEFELDSYVILRIGRFHYAVKVQIYR